MNRPIITRNDKTSFIESDGLSLKMFNGVIVDMNADYFMAINIILRYSKNKFTW
jgi:hypothetical protein